LKKYGIANGTEYLKTLYFANFGTDKRIKQIVDAVSVGSKYVGDVNGMFAQFKIYGLHATAGFVFFGKGYRGGL